MTARIAGVLLLVAGAPAMADAWGTLEPGEHAVGFETRNVADEFRGTAGPDGPDSRPIQVSVWYPAKTPNDSADRMTLADYVALTAREASADASPITPAERERALARIADFPLDEADAVALDRALSLEARAVASAPYAENDYPLLVMIPGNHDAAWRHFVLAEYLASHGYVVAAFPSASRRVRADMDMNFGLGPFRDQMMDTAFVTDYLRAQHPLVDADRTMLFGFSIGGNTGGFNLLRDREIDGFVCLDCGIGSTWGTPYLNERFDETFPSAAGRPLAILHVSEGGERNDDSFIDRFENAHAYHAVVADARHFNFTSLGAVAAELPALAHERWLAGGPFARQVHDRTARSVRIFLDAHLKDRPDAAARLRSTDVALVPFHRIAEPGKPAKDAG